MSTVYKWKEGARAPLSANIVGRELESIRARAGGFFTPADVVRAAEPTDAALHPAFEWNDTVAASAYREEQAKYLIRNVVVAEANRADAAPVRMFVSVVKQDDHAVYTSFERALSDDDMRNQILSAARRDMESFERKYRNLAELTGVFAAMDKVKLALEETTARAA